MAGTNASLRDLSDADRQILEHWLFEFDRGWGVGELSRRVRALPPDCAWRSAALIEMIKIDLERNWRGGRRIVLESYLADYPELAGGSDLPADLIQAEYEVRRQFDRRADLADFERRFPRQGMELRRLIESDHVASDPGPAARGEVPPAPAPAPIGPATIPYTAAARVTALPPMALPDPFGRYRILRALGEGGMGAVYLAHDTKLGRRVALKLPRISATDSPDLRARFVLEARAAATLEQPNICPVFDAGEIDGIPYIAMAFVEGRPLADAIRPDRPLNGRQVAAVVRKLALALQEAHAAGVIHRDLKPTNILMNSRREPVIMDFGLARLTSSSEARLTKEGTLFGTPAYMSPEQVGGDIAAMGPACDIYSLGVIFYELLTGRLPFDGPMMVMLTMILNRDPPPPRTLRPDVDSRLEAICLKAIAKVPSSRHASMREFADELTEYLLDTASPPLTPTPAVASPDDAQVARLFGGLRMTADQPDSTRTRDARPDRNRRPHRRPIAIAVAVVLAALLLGVVAHFATDHATIRIEVRDPGLAVRGDRDRIAPAALAETIPIPVGRHTFPIERAGGPVDSRPFAVRRGGHPPIVVPPGPAPAGPLSASRPAEPIAPADAIGPLPRPGPGTDLAVPAVTPDAPPRRRLPISAAVEPAVPAAGWSTLFNGRDLDGWVVEGQDPGAWRVERGMLTATGTGYPSKVALMTGRDYDDFHLRFEYQLSLNGHAGVVLRSLPDERPGGHPVNFAILLHDDEEPLRPGGPQALSMTGSISILNDGESIVLPDRRAPLSPPGIWNRMDVEARGKTIRVAVNGRLMQDIDLTPFVGRPDAQLGLKRAMGRVGFYRHTGTIAIRNVAIERIGERNDAPAVTEESRPRSKGKRVARPEILRPGSAVSLLALVSPALDRREGDWAFQQSGLVVTPSDWARLALPVAVAGDYDLEVRFTRTTGEDALSIFLPVGAAGRGCCCVLSSLRGALGGLNLVEGKPLEDPAHPARIAPCWIVNDRPHVAVARVRTVGDTAQIVVLIDGKPVIDWKGPQSALAFTRSHLPDPRTPGLGAHRSTVVFHGARLRMESGAARLLRRP